MESLNILDILKNSSRPKFLFDIEGIPGLEVINFEGHEKVCGPFKVELYIASPLHIEYQDVIGKEALLKITGGVADRFFHGVVRKFEHTGKSKSRKYLYTTEIVPYFELLSLEKDCRIFEGMNIHEIIKNIFEESEIEPKLFEFRYVNKNRLRKYCVQYNESKKDFIERLLQEERMFYFFEHYEDRHVMVFGQDQSDYTPPKYDDEIIFMAASGMNETEECISRIDFSKRLTSGTYTHTNYNFKNPVADLEKDDKSKDKKTKKYEIYEYPGLYGETDRGGQLAESGLKAQQAYAEQANGDSNSNRLVPGYVFNLVGHDFESFNKEYVVIDVKHNGQQPQTLEEEAQGGTNYFNSFFVIPSTVDYSPKKTIEKPLMRGPQTAKVVGREGDEICTDEFGRIKVQFHWDRKGQDDENSSCWLRCAQLWGGAGWGAQFTPRVGDEVIVEFLNGDPDFPVIMGSLYNGTNPPPHGLPDNKTRSTIKTRSTPNAEGFNELSFEDKAGSEEIYIHGEKDWNILIKNDKGQNVGHDETLTVGNKRTKTVGANQDETITLNSTETVGLAKVFSTGGLYQITVGAAMNETVMAAKTEEVGLVKAVVVGTNMTEYVKGDRRSTVDGNMSETIENKHTSKAKEYVLEADKITFKAGGSTIIMDSSSITLKSQKINKN